MTAEQLTAVRDASTALTNAVDPEGALSNKQKTAMIYTD